jgi:glycosyltransferase involved in cell wall biosynthesis
MQKLKITVFTAPLVPKIKREPGFKNFIKYWLKIADRIYYWKKYQPKVKYGGHFGVTRSLCEGLAKLRNKQVQFNYNPRFKWNIHPNVIVLDGIERLADCIKLKNSGKIKILFGGPNLMVRPNEYNRILTNEAIDKVIVPGEWVKTAYIEDEPILQNKIIVWPVGIDEKLFVPARNEIRTKKILIYQKNAPESLMNEVAAIIENLGYTQVLIKYGTYNNTIYRQYLDHIQAAVFLSVSESQGIALLEAWAMNVPTFVWQSKDALVINGKLFSSYSAAPFLTSETGLFFNTTEDLKHQLDAFINGDLVFNPRNWVLKNMTDKICAEKLVASFSNEQDNK